MIKRIEKLEHDLMTKHIDELKQDLKKLERRVEKLERDLAEKQQRDLTRIEVGCLRTSYSAHTLETNQFGLLQAGGGTV
jgi:cell division septum initiation protein DivIVA